MHDTTTTPVPNTKLSTWLFAVQHAQHILRQRIAASELGGFSIEYDQSQLKTLDDLQQFLAMSWTDYMDKIEANIKELEATGNV